MKGFIKQLTDDLKKAKVRIEKFYPYTSIVDHRFISMDQNHKTPYDKELLSLYDAIDSILLRRGISPDNKTAVKISTKLESNDYWEIENGSIYVGKYDGIVSIGYSVRTESGFSKYIKAL
jgi:hypothetical protein